MHCRRIENEASRDVSHRHELRRWYQSHLGQLLLEAEATRLTSVLADLFGYYLVQIGCMVDENLIAASRIRRRFILDKDRELISNLVAMLGRPDLLPIASDSIDVVVLAHTLEFEANPHEVLREVDRILIPEGHAIIIGFNPWGSWGLWKLLSSRRRHAPWCGKFRGVVRVKDWLALLGFDIVRTEGFFFRPPLQSSGIMKRLAFMETAGQRWWPLFGAVYLIVARKREITLTPIKSRWRPRRNLLGAGLAKPTVNKESVA